MDQALRDRLQALLEPVVQEMGFELWELELGAAGRGMVLRVLIDRAGGICLADCQAASQRISILLDAEDPIPQKYVLEVASPGIDRSLRGPADYRRYAGQKVAVRCTEPVQGLKLWKGILRGADDTDLVLEAFKEGEVRIPLVVLASVRIDFFAADPAKPKRRK